MWCDLWWLKGTRLAARRGFAPRHYVPLRVAARLLVWVWLAARLLVWVWLAARRGFAPRHYVPLRVGVWLAARLSGQWHIGRSHFCHCL